MSKGGWLATTLRKLRRPLVFLLRGFLSSALSRETHSSRVSHIAATRTGTTTPSRTRRNRAGTLLRRVQLKAKKTTTTMMTKSAAAAAKRRRRRRRWRAREAALLYVAPNLSRGNYCARNCRSERNPSSAARRTRRIGL